ncbi:MAG: HAD family hydrolase [Bacteroidota bacterium]
MSLQLIAFDADDTLWAHESIFHDATNRYKTNLEHHVSHEVVEEKLYTCERENLKHFGYGIKGFILSMIETAIEITEGKITASEIQEMVDLGKWMLSHPVEVLPNVQESLLQLKEEYKLIMITKGDLFDQESKIARSGLAEHFNDIHIVSEKDEACYQRIFEKHEVKPEDTVMVGNSLRSDILPTAKIGGHAIHIPFHVTWLLEQVEDHHLHGITYHELSDIAMVPDFVRRLAS